MRGLIIKDIFVIAKQLKIFLIIIPIIAITGGGTAVALIPVLLGSILPMTAIAYDERSRWNDIAVMMPYSKRMLVTSKYVLGYLCIGGATILVIIGQVIMTLMGKIEFLQNANILLLSISGGLLFVAINMPILFRFGSEKGRLVYIFAMIGIAACGPLLKNLNVQNPFTATTVGILPLLLLCAAIILTPISIMLSLKIKPRAV